MTIYDGTEPRIVPMSATTSAKAPPQVGLTSDQALVLKVIPMPADPSH